MVKTPALYNYCEQQWKIDYLKLKCLNISYGLAMFISPISLTRAFHSGCFADFYTRDSQVLGPTTLEGSMISTFICYYKICSSFLQSVLLFFYIWNGIILCNDFATAHGPTPQSLSSAEGNCGGQLGCDDPHMHSSSCRALGWEVGNSLYLKDINC